MTPQTKLKWDDLTPDEPEGVADHIAGEATRLGMRTSSFKRTPEHNRAVGGAPRSHHLTGNALDLVGTPEQKKATREHLQTLYGDEISEMLDEGDHLHVAWKPTAKPRQKLKWDDLSDESAGPPSVQPATPPAPQSAFPGGDTAAKISELATNKHVKPPAPLPPFQEDREAEHQFETAKAEGNTTAVAHHALTLRAKGYEVGQDADGNPYQKRPESAPVATRLDRTPSGRMRRVAAPTQPAQVPENVVPSVQAPEQQPGFLAQTAHHLRANPKIQGLADVASTIGEQVGKYGSAAYDLMFRPSAILFKPETPEEKEAKARQDQIEAELKDLHFKTQQEDTISPEVFARVQELHQEHDAISGQVAQERAKQGVGHPLQEASAQLGREHGLPPGIPKNIVRGAAGMAIPTAATMLTGGAAAPAIMGGLTAAEEYGGGASGPEALGHGVVSGLSIGAMGGVAGALDKTALGAASKLAGRALANTGIGLGAQALEGGNVIPKTPEERTAFFGQRIFDVAFALMHSPEGHGLTEEQATAKAREQVAQEVQAKTAEPAVEPAKPARRRVASDFGEGVEHPDQSRVPGGHVRTILDNGRVMELRVEGANPKARLIEPTEARAAATPDETQPGTSPRTEQPSAIPTESVATSATERPDNVETAPVERVEEAVKNAAPALPSVGQTIEWEAGFDGRKQSAEVVRLQVDPVTGEQVPIVRTPSGRELPVAEWYDSGRIVGDEGKRVADSNPAAETPQPVAEATSIEPTVEPQPPATTPGVRGGEIVSETPATGPEGIAGAVRDLSRGRRSAERDAETDALTGLGNQGAWEKALPKAEADPNLSIITTDINNMKAKNAVHGHQAGHETIKQQAEALKQAAAEMGENRVFRSGKGDEFSAIVPKEKAEAISRRAEELFKEEALPNGFKVSMSADHGATFKEAEAKLDVRKEVRKGKGGSYRPADIGKPEDFPEELLPEEAKAAYDSLRRAVTDREWSRLHKEIADAGQPDEATLSAFRERSKALGLSEQDTEHIISEGHSGRVPANVADTESADSGVREGQGNAGASAASERPQDVVEPPHHSEFQPRDESGHFDGPPEFPPDHPKAEGSKERALPNTLAAAGLEPGTNKTYEPQSLSVAEERGRAILKEKGVDGAMEFARGSEASAERTVAGFAAIRELQDRAAELASDSKRAGESEALMQKAADFASEFAEKMTRTGQAINAVKAIEMFSPDRQLYIATKLAKNVRKGKGLTPEEATRVTSNAEELNGALKRVKHLEGLIAELDAERRANDVFEAGLREAKGKKKGSSLLSAIRKAGGISESESDIAMHFSNREGGHGLVREGGLSVEDMVDRLREDGFILPGYGPLAADEGQAFDRSAVNPVDSLLEAMHQAREGKHPGTYSDVENMDREFAQKPEKVKTNYEGRLKKQADVAFEMLRGKLGNLDLKPMDQMGQGGFVRIGRDPNQGDLFDASPAAKAEGTATPKPVAQPPATRVSIHPHTYRDTPGFSVRSAKGSKIFVRNRETAEAVKVVLQEGRYSHEELSAAMNMDKAIDQKTAGSPVSTEGAKQPWQMTRQEYRNQERAAKFEAIQQALKDGKTVDLPSHKGTTRISNPEHLRLGKTGVEIQQGSKWLSLTEDSVDTLAQQAGMKIPSPQERVYHDDLVAKAASEGKPIPANVRAEYPDLPKGSKLDFGNLERPGERGAIGERTGPLPGDAELIAQYGAANLGKADLKTWTADILNAVPEAEPYLKEIRRRAYEIYSEEKRADQIDRLADMDKKVSKTAAQEIATEVREANKALREAESSEARRVEKERKAQIKEAKRAADAAVEADRVERARVAKEARAQLKETKKALAEAERAEQSGAGEEARQRIFKEQESIKEIRKKILDAERAQTRQEETAIRQKARETAKAAGEAKQAEARSQAEEARQRLDEARKTAKEANKATQKGYRESVGAQREAERTSRLWDTPIRNEATAARERLAKATPDSPQTLEDLVHVATGMMLPEKPGGPPRSGVISTSKIYHDLKEQFPDLVSRKNKGEIFKQAYQRVEDAKSAAREAAKINSMSGGQAGAMTDAQIMGLRIQKAKAEREAFEARSSQAREFRRLSRSTLGRVLHEAQAAPRALKSSIDAPLGRQGLFYLVTHPIKTLREGRTIEGYRLSREGFAKAQQELQEHPDYDLSQQSGLSLVGLSTEVDPRHASEEAFQSELVANLPHIRRSEQAYNLAMNQQRISMFSKYADAGRLKGYTLESNPEFFKEIAHIVNSATGRGNIGPKLQSFANASNHLLFSGRLQISRVQLINDLMNPVKYWNYDPVTRRIAATELLRFAGGMGALFAGAAAMGAKVTTDPDDADFGKAVFGKTHVDLTGGMGGFTRQIYRMMRSLEKTATGQPQADNDKFFEVLKNFGRSKLAPVPGAAVNLIAGTDVRGKQVTLGMPKQSGVGAFLDQNQLIQMVVPMIANDLIDAATEDGWVGVAKAAPAFAGFGLGTYKGTPEVQQFYRELDLTGQKAKSPEGQSVADAKAHSVLTKAAQVLSELKKQRDAATDVPTKDRIINAMNRTAQKAMEESKAIAGRLGERGQKPQPKHKPSKSIGRAVTEAILQQ